MKAWDMDPSDDDYDPFAMASCDPSDQFILSGEVDEMWEEIVDRILNP